MPIGSYHHVVRRVHLTRRRYRRHYLAATVLLITVIAILSLASRNSFDTPGFLGAFANSLVSVTLAYLISLVLGVLIGLGSIARPKLEGVFLPIIDVAQSFPTFALLPILVYGFGHSRPSVVSILVIAMIWPIVFSVITGYKDRREDEAEAARVFGARGWKNLLYYLWPVLRPQILTGSIISWGQAWDTIVGAEIIAGVSGAGTYLGQIGSHGHLGLLLLAIFVYLFLIFVINEIFWLPLLHRYTRFTSES